MQTLRVVAEGLTTSFRYPHFMQGIQPTFEMPPPATIYGHISSALGEWFDPAGVEFAYHFTSAAQFDDVEHVHVLTASSGILPGTRIPKSLEGAVNPFKRWLLFRPRLVLYINKPEWEGAFRSPRYAVTLGRSQDLFTYSSVGVVELAEAGDAYFEHTLAPYHMALKGAPGYVVLMPRFLDYAQHRAPTFARYLVLQRRVHSSELLQFDAAPAQNRYWVDLSAPQSQGSSLGLLFHSFVGEYDDNPVLA